MKITRLDSQGVLLPCHEPLADGPSYGRNHNHFVTLTIGTDDGIEGIGACFYGGPLSGALRLAVERMGEMIIGDDPLSIETLLAKLRNATASAGPGGLVMIAIAGIDMALWDIKGKNLGQSLAAMLGATRKEVPAYASGALMRAYSNDQLIKSAQKLVERGFRQMKTQMAIPGIASPAKEVERARLVREAIGPDIDLMCDINQRWDVHQAIAIGRQVEDVRFFWLEDVTRHDDYQGTAQVAAALTTPITAGECLYGITPFRHMIEAHAVDIVMIDLIRVGGIANWMKVAALAEAFNLPVVSHLFPELHVHLIAAVPNGLTVEYMPWSFGLFEEVPAPVNGKLRVPDRPGLGLRLHPEISHYVVS